MQTKMLEIRDRATFIPVLATKMTSWIPAEHYLLSRAGYSDTIPLIMLTELARNESKYDYHEWGDNNRTLTNAHKFIKEHFDDLKSGDVVDVEYILGETKEPKITERSERWEGAIQWQKDFMYKKYPYSK